MICVVGLCSFPTVTCINAYLLIPRINRVKRRLTLASRSKQRKKLSASLHFKTSHLIETETCFGVTTNHEHKRERKRESQICAHTRVCTHKYVKLFTLPHARTTNANTPNTHNRVLNGNLREVKKKNVILGY
jgi:hypothetical protein